MLGKEIQWNPVNTVTNGPKKLAVLMRVFSQENVWRFLLGGQKKWQKQRGDHIAKVAVRWGFTVQSNLHVRPPLISDHLP